MKIPFDMKYRPQIESGEYKVITRTGCPVRIICWDRKIEGVYAGKNIIALITVGEDGTEDTCAFYQDGYFWCKSNDESDSDYDLFIITPESELTPLAQALSNYLKNDFEFFARKEWDEKKWNEVMNTQAVELLAIAKKELLGQWIENMKDEYERGKRDGLTIGYNKAMKEYNESVAYHYPTYEPPCFHGGVCTNPMRDCINCPMHSSGATTNTTTSGTCKKD